MRNRLASTVNVLEGVVWRKSSYSGGGQSQCVEIADVCAGAGVAVRDSKNPTGPVLLLAGAAFACFLDGATGGDFARS
jgi:hypothetical protein